MEAGRELDIAIARDVMKWRVIERENTDDSWQGAWTALDETPWDDDLGDYRPVALVYPHGVYIGTGAHQLEDDTLMPWSPSTDIADAWLVVEKMKADGWFVEVSSEEEVWAAFFAKDVAAGSFGNCHTDAAPHAITLAALRAVGVDSRTLEEG